MRDVAVIGVGMTQFGKFPDIAIEELGRIAVWEAVKDAAIDPRHIDAAYCGNLMVGRITGEFVCCGQRVLERVGIKGIPVTNVENACSSGSTAFREAWIAVAAGTCDIALVIGVEKLTGAVSAPLVATGVQTLKGAMGAILPGIWALRAKRHMREFGTTLEQMAMVSVKNYRNGALNPHSQSKRMLTVEEVLNGPMVAEPLTRNQCCPVTDGAAAAILCSIDKAREYSSKIILVAAAELGSGTYQSQRNIAVDELETAVAHKAYEFSGIDPADMDLAEVHDCFSIAEIVRIEGLGLCKQGEGGRMVAEGRTEIGGDLPVNPSGGLLGKGHPVGATGVAQVAEIVWQLRGEAGKRQVEGAKVGLTHCSGGLVAGDTGACTVIILKK